MPHKLVLESYLSDAKLQKVPSTMLIDYKGHGYSVPKRLIGKTVKIVENDDELQIYYNNDLICTHQVTDQPFNYRPEDYYEGLESALKGRQEPLSIEEMTRKNLAGLARIKGNGEDFK